MLSSLSLGLSLHNTQLGVLAFKEKASHQAGLYSIWSDSFPLQAGALQSSDAEAKAAIAFPEGTRRPRTWLLIWVCSESCNHRQI